MMTRLSIRPLAIGVFLGAAVTLGAPALARAACGDFIVDAGEDCDPGSAQLGVGCCDTTCHWVPTGGRCVPQGAGASACKQSTCNANHTCEAVIPPEAPIDPCTLGATCQKCVATGPKTTDFTCTGGAVPANTVCTSDANKCTLEVCSSGGVCTLYTTNHCPPSLNSCKVAVCDPGDGSCSTVNKSQGTFCNDGNPCTRSEQCGSAGGCTQERIPVPDTTPCDDLKDCTTGEYCENSVCKNGVNKPEDSACDDFNDCIDGAKCTAGGNCTKGGTTNADGTTCVVTDEDPNTSGIDVAAGESFNGNTCMNAGTCASGKCQGTHRLDRLPCTNGDVCNPGLCSNGACARHDPTIEGAVEDQNSCTTPGSTSCNGAGVVSGATCAAGNCVACSNSGCGTDPAMQYLATPIPCGCTYAQ